MQSFYEDASTLFYTCLGIYKHLMKADKEAELDYAKTLLEIAGVAQYTNDVDRAKGMCLISLRIFRAVYEDQSMFVAQVHCKLAALCNKIGGKQHTKEAKHHVQMVLRIVEDIHGGDAAAIAAKGE